jgi:hypothetical protein
MNSFERVAAEYEQIKSTMFWDMFIGELQKKRAMESRFCEVNENVIRNQGAIMALDYIIGRGESAPPLAERLLDELRQKSKGG